MDVFDILSYCSLGFNGLQAGLVAGVWIYNFMKNRVCCNWHCVKFDKNNDMDEV
jgi:hypothetical protein